MSGADAADDVDPVFGPGSGSFSSSSQAARETFERVQQLLEGTGATVQVVEVPHSPGMDQALALAGMIDTMLERINANVDDAMLALMCVASTQAVRLNRMEMLSYPLARFLSMASDAYERAQRIANEPASPPPEVTEYELQQAYGSWLEGRPDTPELRAAWAQAVETLTTAGVLRHRPPEPASD